MQDYDWHHIALIIDESEAANVLVRGTLERTFKALSDSYKTYVDIQEFSKKTAVVSGSSELPGTTKTDTGDGINYEKYLLNAKKSSRGNKRLHTMIKNYQHTFFHKISICFADKRRNQPKLHGEST